MKNRVVLIGAGGHAKVIIDILRSDPTLELIGCVSQNDTRSHLLDLPILGGDEVLTGLFNQGLRHVFVAIGDNAKRSRLLRVLVGQGFSLVNAVSPKATLSSRARCGTGVAVMPGAIVNVDTVLEDGVIVNTGATVDHDCSIGAFAHIAPGAHLAGNVIVGTGAFLGVGSSVIPGLSIGPWTTVGAGSAVVRDLPGYAVAYGIPARVQRLTETPHPE